MCYTVCRFIVGRTGGLRVDWGLFFGLVGTVVALVSLGWNIIREIVHWRHRARLVIQPVDPARDVRTYRIKKDDKYRRFVNLHVANVGRRTAIRAVATLEILTWPDGFTPRERSYALHWAAVEDSGISSGAEPVDIGSELRRLDVAFSEAGNPIAGSWVAYPLALAEPGRHQGHLPTGDYDVLVRVAFDGGKACETRLLIHSPGEWGDLDAVAAPSNKGIERTARGSINQ